MPRRSRADGNTHIYALHDPTEESRAIYIGRTTDPARRAYDHRWGRRGGPLLRRWLEALRARGAVPELRVLEVVPAAGDWEEAERFWIESLRYLGAELVNLAKGGLTWWVGEDGKRRIAAALSARVIRPETRGRLSASLKGRKLTPEWIEKMAATKRGRPLPEATAAAQAATMRALPARGRFGFKGVVACRDRFHARIGGGGLKAHQIGSYATAEEAATAYDTVARAIWGAAAALNFPRPGEKSARAGVEPQDWDLPAVVVRLPAA